MKTKELMEKIANQEVVTEEMAEAARIYLEKYALAQEKRRIAATAKRAEKNAEKEPLRNAIFELIGEEPKTATTLIEEAGLELKPQSIPSLLKPFVEAGKIEKVDVKVKGKGIQKGYKRI